MSLRRQRFQIESSVSKFPLKLVTDGLSRERAEARARELTTEHVGTGITYIAIPRGDSWAVARVAPPPAREAAAESGDELTPQTRARSGPEQPDDQRSVAQRQAPGTPYL